MESNGKQRRVNYANKAYATYTAIATSKDISLELQEIRYGKMPSKVPKKYYNWNNWKKEF